MCRYSICIFFFSCVITTGTLGNLITSVRDLEILVGETAYFNVSLTEPLSESITVNVSSKHTDVVTVDPSIIVYPKDSSEVSWRISLTGHSAGHVTVSATVSPENVTQTEDAFVHVTVQKSEQLTLISLIIGWIYFFAWSISFYPQIYENFKRKSVVGLNFDFLALNLVGFTLYGMFNCGLYWIPEVEAEYFRRNPRGLNPVQLNDIVFAVHAAFATLITIAQCLCYESADQRVSTTARSILSAFFLIFITSLGLTLFNVIEWLDFLYYCSYIKLTITLIKYVPQAFMNYQRKSTVGWSIGNVLLDFTGGMLSMGQMLINAYNFNDWASIFGDPTKFGLGLFSVFFDVFFIIQHYILYRHRPAYEPLPSGIKEYSSESSDENTPLIKSLVVPVTGDVQPAELSSEQH